MKTIARQFLLAFLLIGTVTAVVAAEKSKAKVVNIKTSAICESCKARIEKALKGTEGVQEAMLNLDSKQVKVKYDPAVTTPEKLRAVVSGLGYNADEVKANADAYAKLPKCCQKPGVCDPSEHGKH